MSEQYTGIWGEWGEGAGKSELWVDRGDLSNERLPHSVLDHHLNMYPRTAPPSGRMEPIGLMMLEYVSRLNHYGSMNGNDPFDPRPIDPIVELSLQAQRRCNKDEHKDPRISSFSSSNSKVNNVLKVDEHAFMDGHGIPGASDFSIHVVPTDCQHEYQLITKELNYQPCPRLQTRLESKDRLKTSEVTIDDENPPRRSATTDKGRGMCILDAVCNPCELRGNSHDRFLDPACTIIESSEAMPDIFPAAATATTEAGCVPAFDELPCDMTPPAHLLDRLHELMRSSISSEAMIQAWDTSHGSPRCHSWTMLQTSRSQRQILEGNFLLTK